MLQKLKSIQIPLILFVISLIIGLLVFKHYGVAWDEAQQRNIGLANYQYIFEGNDRLLTLKDKDYGMAFELPLYMVEKIFDLQYRQTIHQSRHFLNHLLFLFSAFFLFLLIDLIYQNKIIASIGYFMLLLQPRIYAHSFFNTKDLPFLSFFIIALYFVFLALYKDKKYLFLIAGFLSGLLINLRIMGILIIALLGLYLVLQVLMKEIKVKKALVNFSIYISVLIPSLILSWPYLWKNPFGNFIQVFINMSKFRWKDYIVFWGEHITGKDIPISYFPTWFSISNPVIFLILGLAGILLGLFFILRKPIEQIKLPTNKSFLIFLCMFASPIMAIIILKSVIYDGWRHLFFIYPAFIMLAIHGLYLVEKVILEIRIKKLLLTFIAILFFDIIIFMVQSHPLQNVFFNSLISHEKDYIRNNFDMDYWGTSYKQAYDFILQYDERKNIKICFTNRPGLDNLAALDPSEQKRLQLIQKIEESDYCISNYRWSDSIISYLRKKEYPILYERRVHNSSIITIWKIQ